VWNFLYLRLFSSALTVMLSVEKFTLQSSFVRGDISLYFLGEIGNAVPLVLTPKVFCVVESLLLTHMFPSILGSGFFKGPFSFSMDNFRVCRYNGEKLLMRLTASCSSWPIVCNFLEILRRGLDLRPLYCSGD
jgi:hypothetical protein